MKTYIIVLFAALLPVAVFAQTQLDERIDITRPYKPQLTAVNKIEVSPQNENMQADVPQLDYNIDAIPANLPVSPPDIRPLNLGREQIPQLHRLYAKLGAGNYSNLFADVYYNSLRNENQLLAARLYHNSGKGPLQHSQFRENELSLYGKQIWRRNVLAADVSYTNDKVHFHGHPDSILNEVVRRDIRQIFNQFNMNASFDNSKADSGKMNYWVNTGYTFFGDRFEAREHNPHIGIHIREYLGQNSFDIAGRISHLGYGFEGVGNPRSLLTVNAAYNLKREMWNVSAGFKTATEFDTADGGFSFFPDVHGEAKVAGDFLILYGGITGDVQQNSFRSFATENPFIVSNPDLRNTRNTFQLYTGAKGTLSNRMAARAGISYSNFEDMHFFLNDSLDSARFVVVYDEGNTNLFNLNAEFIYDLTNRFKLGLSTNVNRYSLSSQEHAWHRPAFTTGLHARYNMEDKISFHTGMFFNGKRYAKIAGGDQITELDPYFDLNAGIQYNFNNRFGAFIDFKNILSPQYEVYNHYPVRGFNILGGATVNF